MNLSTFFVEPYNKRFDWDGLLLILTLEVGVLVVFLTVNNFLKRKNGRKNLTRFSTAFKLVVLIGYIVLVLSQTWFMSSRNYERRININLFWSYRTSLEWMIEGVQIENSRILEQICLNIFMFIPLGFLLPESFANLTEKTWKVIIAGCMFSVIIEVGQYIMHSGLCELDDVFNNTLGCFVGLLIWKCIRRVFSRKGAMSRQ